MKLSEQATLTPLTDKGRRRISASVILSGLAANDGYCRENDGTSGYLAPTALDLAKALHEKIEQGDH